MTEQERLRKAASVMADFFASTVMRALDETPRRTILYGWEERALDLLRLQWETDPGTSINMWTANYIKHGPPPWQNEEVE